MSAGNIIEGSISRIEPVTGQTILRIEAGSVFFVRVTPPAVRRMQLQVGTRVFLIIKTRSCVIF
jgi:molybdopterin-binding protein